MSFVNSVHPPEGPATTIFEFQIDARTKLGYIAEQGCYA
jgi:hypothetical protein